MTPSELESRCRKVGVWPVEIEYDDAVSMWLWNDYITEEKAHALILAELVAKMPEESSISKVCDDGKGSFLALGHDDRDDDEGVDRGGFHVNLGVYKTPLEAALACHEQNMKSKSRYNESGRAVL